MTLITAALTKASSRKTKREKLRQALSKQLVGETSNEKGRGLVALADFAAGEIVAPIDGVHTWGGEELTTLGSDPLEDYSFVCDMGGGRFRKTDPVMENVGWHLANHSCSPNARLSSFVIAERRIDKGAEITFSYGWTAERAAEMTCLCGSPHCYGTIGPRVHNLKTTKDEIEAWREYLDALLINRNTEAIRLLRSAFDPQSFRMVTENSERADKVDQIAARPAPLYDYELPIDRMESLSF